MKKILVLVVGASVLASARTAIAVPVVPNFTQGSMTSNTETTSTVSETINSMNYDTGDNAVSNGIGAMTFSSGVGSVADTTFTQDVPGASFSLSQSFVQGDAIATSAPTVGAVSAYSDQVSTAAGTAGTLAGTITTAGAMTVTGGGAGTVATGQFVNELTVN